MATSGEDDLAPREQAMLEVWQRHLDSEFQEHSADAALETMSATPHLNHVPVMTGGVGRNQIRTFYATHFIPRLPPDTEIELISRTIGRERIVDEMIFKCTHTVAMDWFLPGVAPTGRRIEVPTVAIVEVPRRQNRERAHLLGSGERARADRPAGRRQPAGRRRRDRREAARSDAPLERADRARRGRRGQP